MAVSPMSTYVNHCTASGCALGLKVSSSRRFCPVPFKECLATLRGISELLSSSSLCQPARLGQFCPAPAPGQRASCAGLGPQHPHRTSAVAIARHLDGGPAREH